MDASSEGMDVEACMALLHDRNYQVAELELYYAELEAKSGLALPNVRELLNRVLFVNRGERHIALRRAALAFFRTPIVAAWRPVIAALAEQAVERLEGRSEADLVADFARPLAAEIVCRIMGLPTARWDDYERWTGEALWVMEPFLPLRRLPPVEAALEQFASEVRAALAGPAIQEGDGRRSFLHFPIDGLEGEERVWLAISLYGASNVTRHTLANTILHLSRVAPPFRAILADPAARTEAVERLIAAGASFVTVTRYRAEEGGIERRIEVPVAAASRAALGGRCPVAEAQNGPPVEHVAFGAGVHRCVGAFLARIVIAEALTALVRRYPAFSIARQPSGFIRSALVTSPLDLPCTLD
jgi:cytochrome P450